MSRERFIQTRLRESFSRHGELIAIRQGNTQIPYRRLLAMAENYAAAITAAGLKPGQFVAISLTGKIDTIAAIIGTLICRCAFAPLDPALPRQRIEYMLKQVAPSLAIVDRHTRGLVDGTLSNGSRVLDAAELDGEIQAGENSLWRTYAPEDRIYAYFTSGSSGRPKGIVGQNKSLDQFIQWEIETFEVDHTTRVSQLIAVGFDAFLRDMLVPLCAGGTLCLPEDGKKLPVGQGLVDWLEQDSVNLVHCVPSVFRLFNLPHLKPDNFPNLRHVLLSGERIPTHQAKQWFSVFGERVRLVNLYGPSETTMIKTFHPIAADDLQLDKIPAGKPMKGAQLFIFDKHMKLCGKQRVGEIYIRTPFRTLGYLNDPTMTEDRFIPNPVSGDRNDRLYRTGDLGRLLADGNLELLGRIDRQVKINGVRVEPEEIEQVMSRYPGLTEAVVNDLDQGDGNSVLCAYYTSDPAITPQELREFLNRQLPDYLVPAHLMPLDNLPLSPNGKVDRRALPLPAATDSGDYVPPQGLMEQQLATIIEEVLETEAGAVGRDTDIFGLGANSLKIIVILSALAEQTQLQIPFEEAYKRPTVRELAQYIESQSGTSTPQLHPREKMDYYPVSPAQSRIYMQQQVDPTSTAYNMPRVIRLHGRLDIPRLQRVFDSLVQRHHSLRTYYTTLNETVVQRLAEACLAPLEISTGQEETEWVAQMLRPFQLDTPPLFRVALLKNSPEDHLLMIDLHHIAADASSLDILTREFAQAYQGETLPELELHYRDYAVWLAREDNTSGAAAQKTFWLEQFSGEIPVLELPTDYPHPQIAHSHHGEKIDFPLDKELVSQLRELAASEHTTMFCVLLTVFYIFLARLSGQEDIVVGTATTGRKLPVLNPIVGIFVNLLAMRNFPRSALTIREFLRQVTTRTIDIFANQDYPFEELVEQVAGRRDLGRSPLFDVLFQLDNRTEQTQILYGETIGDLRIQQYDRGVRRMVKWDLNCIVTELGDQILVTFAYATHLFKEETVRVLIDYFKRIATFTAQAPDKQISEISLQKTMEHKQKLMDYLCDDLENEF